MSDIDRENDSSTSDSAGGEVAGRLTNAEYHRAYRGRCDSLIDQYAGRDSGGYIEIAAKLYRGRDSAWCSSRLQELMKHPRGDMFWTYPSVLVAFLARDRLPQSILDKMRDLWRTYTPYRGDTENHWAMYYTSLYLMAQLYPDDPGSMWFNGRNSRENLTEANDYLLSWMDLTTTRGQGEFDSPTYMNFFLTPMAELYAFAKDPKMRLRGAMMLDYLIADFAAESLDGLYVGAHSRVYPETVLDQEKAPISTFAWLLFGMPALSPHGEAVILAISGYQPPAILYHIATDRSQPYVHRELKRTRHRIRHSEDRDAPVFKYTRVRSEYAMGCVQGGLLQPIQQHSWDITWRVQRASAGPNTLFTLHPYASEYELAMYFPEEPRIMIEDVLLSKPTYDKPDKWTGGSPFEQIFQHEDALVALYHIPPGTRFPHISGFFSKALSKREEDASGWLFLRGGEALIAYYPLAPYEWREAEDHWRLHSDLLENGAIVQAAPASAYANFEEFKKHVRARELIIRTDIKPYVRYRTLSGDIMEAEYGSAPRLNGELVDYDSWKLFDGPFLLAEKDSGSLEIRHGRRRRLLDFQNLTLTESAVGA